MSSPVDGRSEASRDTLLEQPPRTSLGALTNQSKCKETMFPSLIRLGTISLYNARGSDSGAFLSSGFGFWPPFSGLPTEKWIFRRSQKSGLCPRVSGVARGSVTGSARFDPQKRYLVTARFARSLTGDNKVV